MNDATFADRRIWSKYFLFMIAGAFAILLTGLGKQNLTGPDEPRVAGISAEMARSHELIVPMLNGRPFLEQPPLYHWIASTAYRIFGETAWTARLPSAIAAFLATVLVFLLVRSWGRSPLAAFLSAMILATTVQFWKFGRADVVDMTLVFFVACALASYITMVRDERRRWIWAACFALATSAAIMTKGLIGLAIPSSTIFFWLILTKQKSLFHWTALFAGSALALVPVGAWLLALDRREGWDAVHEAAWANNFGRFSGSKTDHQNPFYFYLSKFPTGFLPWTIFAPLAWIDRRQAKRGTDDHLVTMFLACWIVFPFILLSIASGKRDLYLLPLYPAAAMLTGISLAHVVEAGQAESKPFRWAAELLWIAGAILAVAFCGLNIYFKKPFYVWPAALLPGLALSLWAKREWKTRGALRYLHWTVAMLAVLLLTVNYNVYALFNPRKSYVDLYAYLSRLESRKWKIGLYEPSEAIRGGTVYYMKGNRTELMDASSLEVFLGGDRTAVAADKRDLKKAESVAVLKSFDIGHLNYVVIASPENERIVKIDKANPEGFSQSSSAK